MNTMMIALLVGASAIAIAILLYVLRRKTNQEEEQRLSRPQQLIWQSAVPQTPLRSSDELVRIAVHSVPVTVYKVQMGMQRVGERVMGTRMQEVQYPADEVDIRPMRGLEEMPNRVSSESTLSPMMQMTRMVSGDALVMADLEIQPLTEPIYKPVYRSAKKIMYVLLDLSGSMFGEASSGMARNEWMIPIWKGIVLALLERALKEDTIFMMRGFSTCLTHQMIATSVDSGEVVREFLQTASTMGGTNIGLALETAIRDFEQEQYDVGHIVIVTDGMDQGGFDPQMIRGQLEASRLKLHAILLGVDNRRLQETADAYQEIPERGVIRQLVQR